MMLYRYDKNVSSGGETLPSRFLEKIDWLLVLVVFLLVLAGAIAVYSASLHFGIHSKYLTTQFAAVLLGIVGLFIFLTFNYQYLKQMAPLIYAFSVFLLLLVLLLGSFSHGTRGWFHLGFFSFQPVEVTKIFFILVMAAYLDQRIKEIKRLSTLFVSLGLVLGNVILVLIQPDFSSTLVYFPVMLVMLYVAGAEVLYLLCIVIFGTLAAGIPLMATFFKMQPALLKAHPLLNYMVLATSNGNKAFIIIGCVILILFVLWWLLNELRFRVPFLYFIVLSGIILAGTVSSFVVQKSLKEYQRKRLIVFINPEVEPLGAGYNIIQSKIAIGSGRLFGKGLFQGTQSQLGFLPEQHTDFIFSVLGEEAGFVFSELVIVLYFLLIWRAMVIARDARDRYGSLVAVGVGTMFAFYSIINIGMVMGLMPATGLPLPFMSYGGSCMVSSLCAVGVLFSIHVRRYTN